MAENELNPTRAYLIQEGIGDPDALNAVHDELLESLKEAVANTSFPGVSGSFPAQNSSIPPETVIRAATLTRPVAGNLLEPLQTASGSAVETDSLVEGMASWLPIVDFRLTSVLRRPPTACHVVARRR